METVPGSPGATPPETVNGPPGLAGLAGLPADARSRLRGLLAGLHEESRRQQQWLGAITEVMTSLLSGAAPQQVLAMITARAQHLSGADLVVLALPEGRGQVLTIRFAEGQRAADVQGLVLPADRSLSGQVLTTGAPVTVGDFAADPRTAEAVRGPMGHVGPATIFPLGAPGNVRGVLTMGRQRGGQPFGPATVNGVMSFATQAGVALELADRRRDAEQLSLYEDRDRIARDLHDLVIQRLYATGMSLEATVPMIATPEITHRVRNAVDAMDETIKDLRETIFALQTRTGNAGGQLRGEIVAVVDEMAALLGFAPSLRLGPGLDGPVGPEAAESLLTALREALSNTARHARASRVSASVEAAGGQLTLRVTDDGVGVPPGAHRSGLVNLAQRATRLGGTLDVNRPDGGGTELLWRVPAAAGPDGGSAAPVPGRPGRG